VGGSKIFKKEDQKPASTSKRLCVHEKTHALSEIKTWVCNHSQYR